MANVSGKKIQAQNQKTATLLKQAFGAINGYFLIVRIFLQYNSLGRWSIFGYFWVLSISWFMFYQLLALAKPRMVQGKVVGGEDLAAKGLTSYMFDILYVSWFVQIGTTLSDKFWWFYLVVPGYAFYLALTSFILPVMRSRSSGMPVSEAVETSSKKSKTRT